MARSLSRPRAGSSSRTGPSSVPPPPSGERVQKRVSFSDLEEAGCGAPRFLQLDQGGVQPRLDRTDGDAEYVGDLAVLQSLVVGHDQDLTEEVGQLIDGGPDALA